MCGCLRAPFKARGSVPVLAPRARAILEEFDAQISTLSPDAVARAGLTRIKI